MDTWKVGSSAMLAAAVGACGGGGSHNTMGSGTSYAYIPPVLNSSRVYAETIIDNSHNTINIGFSQVVQAVNADGSSAEMQQSTTGSAAIVNGTNYAIPTETQIYNAQGQETSYVDLSNSPNLSCSLDPHGAGPNWPVQVGQTWSLDYTLTCGTTVSVAYAQSGSVVDVESVTVPAGTFTAIKLQTTIGWTSAGGTIRTETITNWRDVATSHSVKQSRPIDWNPVTPLTRFTVGITLLLLLGICRPASASDPALHRPGLPAPHVCVVVVPGDMRPEFGCFRVGTSKNLEFDHPGVYWHLQIFATRRAAEAAKSPRGIVVEEDGHVWLSEFGPRQLPSKGAQRVALVGPLEVVPGKSYDAEIAYSVMAPGDHSRVHTHSGPEAWYVLAGGQCLETPGGAFRAVAGETMSATPNEPMELRVTGTDTARALTLVIHDSTQGFGAASDWKPSGACRR